MLLPNGDYSSVLCGGLKVVFNAAKRQSKVRNAVLDTLLSLPEELEVADLYMELYGGLAVDEKLRTRLTNAAFDLYVVMLGAVEHLLDWLDHNALKHVFKVLYQQDYYGQAEDAQITGLRNKSQALTAVANQCMHFVGVSNGGQIKQSKIESHLGFAATNSHIDAVEAKVLERLAPMINIL